jgi:hypothetical protein
MRSGIFYSLQLLMLSALMSVVHAQTQQQLQFDVYLNDKKIGYHRVDIENLDSGKIVKTEANFKVKFLFFDAYKYQHSAQEKWSVTGCLKTIESKTNDDGEEQFVSGRKDDQQFKITDQDSTERVDGCVRSFAYWDLDLIKSSRLLNSQNGSYLDVTTDFVGAESIVVNGKTINADHYRINSEEMIINVWYSNSKEWVALSTVVNGDNELRYERK